MQNKRITEDEKQKLREMLERERAGRTARPQRQKITKKLSRTWAVAAFICCILPVVLILCGYPFLGFIGIVFFPLIAPPLGIIGVVLAIIAIIKCELRGKILAMVAIVLGVLEIVTGLWLHWQLSRACGPSIYSFDGKEFVFDSEPYAGAILVERTGYSELNRLVAVNGKYRFKMTNELNETQYTGELKLLVVEHHIGTDVVPDVTGHIHTIASPIAPTYACELPGKDILHLVNAKDDRFWESGPPAKSPSSMVGRRKELILEFPKPQNAISAKLVMNVCNSVWSSSLANKFLERFGNWYPFMSAVRSRARKGFIRFEVQAWENGKWTTKGWIRGASPYLPRDQIEILDVSNIKEERLKLRLTLASGFWRINSAIVDYSEDVPIEIRELEASEAVNHRGEDIRKKLRADDDIFYVTEKGDYSMITFNEPPPVSNMARSFILKARGYYKIHASDTEQTMRKHTAMSR